MGEIGCIIPLPHPFPFPGKWIWWLNGLITGVVVTIAAMKLNETRNYDSGPIHHNR
jgi:hypothetical protein